MSPSCDWEYFSLWRHDWLPEVSGSRTILCHFPPFATEQRWHVAYALTDNPPSLLITEYINKLLHPGCLQHWTCKRSGIVTGMIEKKKKKKKRRAVPKPYCLAQQHSAETWRFFPIQHDTIDLWCNSFRHLRHPGDQTMQHFYFWIPLYICVMPHPCYQKTPHWHALKLNEAGKYFCRALKPVSKTCLSYH